MNLIMVKRQNIIVAGLMYSQMTHNTFFYKIITTIFTTKNTEKKDEIKPQKSLV